MMTRVKSGLERHVTEERSRLKGRRLGICCNPTAVDASFAHMVDLLCAVPEAEVVALFGPEHGIRGDAQDMISVDDVSRDPKTGLPVYSLYGHEEASLKPTPAMLEGIDLLLFDIQDIGSRYYTYIYTMSYLMEAAGEAGIEVWVLDRPNPINGVDVEGTLVQDDYRSFVGKYSLPNRHGMTAGELALMFRDHFGVSCKLEVIQMSGWKRSMWMDETGLPWVMPSPNMPTLDTAIVYPGGCLFEGTNLSEARGTTRPFELVGAPYLDPDRFAAQLNGHGLAGVHFRPVYFSPTFHKWGREVCGGIQYHITEREKFRPFLAGVAVVQAALQQAPDGFSWREEAYEFVADRLAMDLLFGNITLREAMEAGASLTELEAGWQDEQQSFLRLREPFLLYN